MCSEGEKKKKQENETVTDGSALGQQKISDMFCTFSAFTCLFSFRKKKKIVIFWLMYEEQGRGMWVLLEDVNLISL